MNTIFVPTSKLRRVEASSLFENLPELLTSDLVAEALHTSRATVYQWHARPRRYGVPDDLFVKLGRKLLIRREQLRTWVLSRSKEREEL